MSEIAKKSVGLSELVTKAVNIAEQTSAAVVTNDDDEQKGFDLLKIIKTTIAKAEAERKATTLEAREFTAAVNDRYKDEVTAPLNKAKRLIESKLEPYALKKLKAQQEATRIERQRIEDEALEAAESSEDSAEKVDMVLDKAANQSAKVSFGAPVRSDYGATTSTKLVYTFEVTDLSQVPAKYLVLNESLVKKEINASLDRVRKIPGLTIVEGVRMRSS